MNDNVYVRYIAHKRMTLDIQDFSRIIKDCELFIFTSIKSDYSPSQQLLLWGVASESAMVVMKLHVLGYSSSCN